MGRRLPPLLLAAALAASAPAAVPAQERADGGGAAARTPQERRDQLAKVQEMLADPDPLLRLANMEAIVASGDALKIRIAIRTAFASDDTELRGLALRAYLATHKEITFDVLLPPAAQKQYDATSPDKVQEIYRQYPFLERLYGAAFRFRLMLTDYTLGQDGGTLQSGNEGHFTITGERFSTFVGVRDIGSCYVDFWPGRKQTLDGTLACGSWPKLAITAPAS